MGLPACFIGSGTQPDPGTYVSLFYLDYTADTLRDQDGNSFGIDPERRGDLDVQAYGAGLIFVGDLYIQPVILGRMGSDEE